MHPNYNFAKLFQKAKEFYQNIGSIYCPALKTNIYFTAEGFHHLRYKGSRNGRTKQERRNKLAYLTEAAEILKITTTYQEYRETMTKVAYYGFCAVLEKNNNKIRIRVITRKTINSREYIFWSIMPDWKIKIIHGQRIKYFASASIENN